MFLAVKLHTQLFDELQLRLQKVDVMLLINEGIIVKLLGNAVMNRNAIFRRFRIKSPRRYFGGKVAADNLFHRLPDSQWVENLKVGKSFEKQNPRDQPVGMPHFLNRFFAPALR